MLIGLTNLELFYLKTKIVSEKRDFSRELIVLYTVNLKNKI